MSTKRTHNNLIDDSYGGVTIAYNPVLVIRKNSTSIGVFVEIGAARCRGNDRYVKSEGRAIALDNLERHDAERFDTLYLGEGECAPYTDAKKIPLTCNGAGDLFINERLYDLKATIAQRLGFVGY